MAKKKKHKKKKKYLSQLKVIDMGLSDAHDRAIADIESLTTYLKHKDEKIKKKSEKVSRNGLLSVFNPQEEQQNVRMKVIKALEETRIIDLADRLLTGIMPIVITLARLLATLIVLIFQCKPIRNLISPTTVRKLDSVYQVAMAIH